MSIPWPVLFPVPPDSKLMPLDRTGSHEYKLHAHSTAGITAMVLLQGKGLLFTAR